jgi:pimeloyl-ACP methyl ester carboxylesterase
MRYRTLLSWKLFFVLLFAAGLHAQEIAGTWQGTVDVGQKLRVIVQIDKADGGIKGQIYSIDQTPHPKPLTKIAYADTKLAFSVDAYHASYEGTLSPDGKTITGTMTQGVPKPLVFERAVGENAWAIPASPHTAQMIAVDKEVKLEVLDYGGTGRPLVLLTGLGDDAHVFDKFAPKLSGTYHVYGVTRRGFGDSSKPEFVTANYTVAHLGEDVLAVIDNLHLVRPIVAGHSIAGEELSYIGNEHPDKIAGLIYIYDTEQGSFLIDALDLREQLNHALPGGTPPDDMKKTLDGLIASLKLVEREVIEQRAAMEDMPPPPGPRSPAPPVGTAIMTGQQRFTKINAPALFIYASPHDLGQMMKDNPKARAAMEARDKITTERQIAAVKREVPEAHVVVIPNANHYLFRTNEADVLREMNNFIATLPATAK